MQPNLEILAYRQGLSPGLIVRLSRFALWKTLGAACTLLLEPTIVYRGLESGESLESLVQTLDRYGMKSTPTSVLDALRTWSNKRERITVYPSAALFEFVTPEDLAEALSRACLPNGSLIAWQWRRAKRKIDYKHFRLTGTRDYCLPPERCVDVEEDGVTLNIDLARSDLLLETELQRFAEPLDRGVSPGRKSYRLTPPSLKQARQRGFGRFARRLVWSQRRPTAVPCRIAVAHDERRHGSRGVPSPTGAARCHPAARMVRGTAANPGAGSINGWGPRRLRCWRRTRKS
ncbi:MAG: hypothetical protein U0744_06395 [Gemmataceae bacterium]